MSSPNFLPAQFLDLSTLLELNQCSKSYHRFVAHTWQYLHVDFQCSNFDRALNAFKWLGAAGSCGLTLRLNVECPEIPFLIPANCVSLTLSVPRFEIVNPFLQCPRLAYLDTNLLIRGSLAHLPLRTLRLERSVSDLPSSIRRLEIGYNDDRNFFQNLGQAFPCLTHLNAPSAILDARGLKEHASLKEIRVDQLVGNELPPGLETLHVNESNLTHDALPLSLRNLRCLTFSAALSRFTLPILQRFELEIDSTINANLFFDLPSLETLNLKSQNGRPWSPNLCCRFLAFF